MERRMTYVKMEAMGGFTDKLMIPVEQRYHLTDSLVDYSHPLFLPLPLLSRQSIDQLFSLSPTLRPMTNRGRVMAIS